MSILELSKAEEFNIFVKSTDLSVVHFYADWAEQCKDMNSVLEELSKRPNLKGVKFAKLLAEDLPEVSMASKITAVPTILLFRGGKETERVDGANAAELTTKVLKEASVKVIPLNQPLGLQTRLKALIKSSPVMLFTEGDLQTLKDDCTRQIIQILDEEKIPYKTFDVSKDKPVHDGLQTLSNWTGYPQLYVSGELVLGLEAIKQLVSSKEFKEMLPKSLEDRLKHLINQETVMLFMKGNPITPKCGFSRQIVELLNKTNVKFGTFDILEDEEVRQGLKEFSQWPTYPQLYVKGELVGGLDIIKELEQTGELMKTLQLSS